MSQLLGLKRVCTFLGCYNLARKISHTQQTNKFTLLKVVPSLGHPLVLD